MSIANNSSNINTTHSCQKFFSDRYEGKQYQVCWLMGVRLLVSHFAVYRNLLNAGQVPEFVM